MCKMGENNFIDGLLLYLTRSQVCNAWCLRSLIVLFRKLNKRKFHVRILNWISFIAYAYRGILEYQLLQYYEYRKCYWIWHLMTFCLCFEHVSNKCNEAIKRRGIALQFHHKPFNSFNWNSGTRIVWEYL